jgi:hypothetical protein
LLGTILIHDEMQENPGIWQTAIIGTLAHEWAHNLQYNTDLDERLFLWETHADYMAGWYIGSKVALGVMDIKPEAFARSLFLRGSARGVFSDNDYGSPEDRVRAMYAGFSWGFADTSLRGLPNVISAANQGYREISSLIKHNG